MSLSTEGQHLFNYFKMVGASYHEDVMNVYKEISESLGRQDCSQGELEGVISSVNTVIKKYDLEIADGIDDLSSRKMYCLVSTMNNPVPDKVSVYDKITRQLLSKIIEDCIVSGNGYTTEMFCLNCSMDLDTKKSILQSSVERLVKDKWIVSENGKLTLSLRSQMELEVHIKRHFSDYIQYCSLCKTFLVQGFTCSLCSCHMHFHCFKKLCKRNNLSEASGICPKCKDKRNGCSGSQDDENSSAGSESYNSDTDGSSKSSLNSDETAIVSDGPIEKRVRRS